MRVAKYTFPRNPNQLEFSADVETIAAEAFPLPEGQPQILGLTDNIVIARNLGKLLNNENVVLACLEDDERQLAGFSLAMPLGMFDPKRKLLEGLGVKTEIKTAYEYYTAIRQDLRGQGLVGDLKAILHHRLIEQKYKIMIGDLVMKGGYALKAKEAYGDSVITSEEHQGYVGTGPEMRLVIDLRNPTKLPGFTPGQDPDPYVENGYK